jgi:hypothetical protein
MFDVVDIKSTSIETNFKRHIHILGYIKNKSNTKMEIFHLNNIHHKQFKNISTEHTHIFTCIFL